MQVMLRSLNQYRPSCLGERNFSKEEPFSDKSLYGTHPIPKLLRVPSKFEVQTLKTEVLNLKIKRICPNTELLIGWMSFFVGGGMPMKDVRPESCPFVTKMLCVQLKNLVLYLRFKLFHKETLIDSIRLKANSLSAQVGIF